MVVLYQGRKSLRKMQPFPFSAKPYAPCLIKIVWRLAAQRSGRQQYLYFCIPMNEATRELHEIWEEMVIAGWVKQYGKGLELEYRYVNNSHCNMVVYLVDMLIQKETFISANKPPWTNGLEGKQKRRQNL